MYTRKYFNVLNIINKMYDNIVQEKFEEIPQQERQLGPVFTKKEIHINATDMHPVVRLKVYHNEEKPRTVKMLREYIACGVAQRGALLDIKESCNSPKHSTISLTVKQLEGGSDVFFVPKY